MQPVNVVARSLLATQLAFLVVGLFVLDGVDFGHHGHLEPNGLKQLARGRVRNGFFLHHGDNNHAGQFLLID